MTEALSHPIFKIVAIESQKLGSQTYIVGGFVRDIFLKRDSKDVDFLTIGNGLDLAKAVAHHFPDAHVSIFKNFGTAQIKTRDWEFEFVGARKESYTRDSRKPIVEDGTFMDDISRRDFTINALAISLSEENYGELVDTFGGIADLKNGILKTPLPPDQTFSDDPLRMIRAARFACQLNFEILPETLEAMQRNKHRLPIVSMERITDEVQKIMAAPKPSIGFKVLFDAQLLQVFFPDLSNLQGVEVINGLGHKDNFYHTLEVLDNVAQKTEDIWIRWAALLHDIAKTPTKKFIPGEGWTFHGHEDKGSRMAKGIFKKLKLPLGEPLRFVSNLVLLHLRPIALTKENISDSAVRRLIFDAGNDLEALLLLCRSDITTKSVSKKQRFLANLDFVEEKIKEVEERDRIRNWQPPIDGAEIMELFGLSPGRQVGMLKNALKEAILDGEVLNKREEAVKFLEEKNKELINKKESIEC